MSYISITQIPIRDENLKVIAGNGSTINTVIVGYALADADGIINSYLKSGGYAVPLLSPIPDEIKAIARSLAVYKLYEWSEVGNTKAAEFYDKAIVELEKIRDGKRNIVGLIRSSKIKVIQPFESETLGNYTESKFNMSKPHD